MGLIARLQREMWPAGFAVSGKPVRVSNGARYTIDFKVLLEVLCVFVQWQRLWVSGVLPFKLELGVRISLLLSPNDIPI